MSALDDLHALYRQIHAVISPLVGTGIRPGHDEHVNQLIELRNNIGRAIEANMSRVPAPAQQIVQYRDDMVRCFVDTEFYEDGSTIDLISLGAVRSDGDEFYAVNREARLDRVSDWVREHVLPSLPPYSDPAWMTREQIAERFARFAGRSDGAVGPHVRAPVSEFWGYYSDYDWVAICQLYGTMMGLPRHFPRYCLDLKQLSWMLGNPKHPPDPKDEHNALADARWNKELFEFLRTIPSGVWGYGRDD